jgi:hypothetical protein
LEDTQLATDFGKGRIFCVGDRRLEHVEGDLLNCISAQKDFEAALTLAQALGDDRQA